MQTNQLIRIKRYTDHTCADQCTNFFDTRAFCFHGCIVGIARATRLGTLVAHAGHSCRSREPGGGMASRASRQRAANSLGYAHLHCSALQWTRGAPCSRSAHPFGAPLSLFASRSAPRPPAQPAPIQRIHLRPSLSHTRIESLHPRSAALAGHDAARQPVAAPPVDDDRTISAQRGHASLHEQ